MLRSFLCKSEKKRVDIGGKWVSSHFHIADTIKRVDPNTYPAISELYITRIITPTAYTARFTSQ